MTSFVQSFIDVYNNIDPRIERYFLVRNTYPVIIILSSYLYFCLKCGPRFMEGRKPFELKKTIIIYNLAQILLSCYMAYEGTVLWSGYNWFCEPIDYSVNPDTERFLSAAWLYLFAKLTELLDTVFFVLRKKFNQVSFLHLFHHTIMPIFIWFGLRYYAGGHSSLLAVLNCYVHIVMYTYYFIAGLGPQYHKYLWWKKQVTIMQLVQFGIIFIHNFFPLFTSCSYPKVLHVACLIFSGFFFYMFADFYYKTYVKNPKEANNVKNQ